MRQYGFEIEIVGNFSCDQIWTELDYSLPNYNWTKDKYKSNSWNVGEDGSVDAEIQSPILTYERIVPELFPVIDVLKRMRAGIHKHTGGHIHFLFKMKGN